MKKYKITIFLILAVLSNRINSQSIDGICSEALLFGVSIENNTLNYEKYDPVVQFKEKYSSLDEVTNKTPEELIKSQMSVINNEWLAFNFENKIEWREKQFDRIKNQDINKNYLTLVRKITYTFKNRQYAILRVNVFDERRSKPTVVTLKAKLIIDRWFLVTEESKSPIEFLMMSLNVDALDALFQNEKTLNTTFNNIVKESWDGDVFKLTKAYTDIGNIMLENNGTIDDVFERNNGSPINSEFQIYKSDYSSNSLTIKANYIIPYLNQNFCYYFDNELSNFDFSNTRIKDFIKLIEQQNEEIKIFPISSFKYYINTATTYFIKYSINDGENKNKIITSVFDINQNEEIKKHENLNSDDRIIFRIINALKPEAIIQFSNGEDNPEYPEINNLKPLVKDSNGILNIEKLAQVIEENKNALSKYMDN